MIKVLHVVSSLNINAGMTSVVMNYYRHMDREKVQFDFLYMYDLPGFDFEEEIHSLGGKTYYYGDLSLSSKYKKSVEQFFSEHANEYCAVHCHTIWAAGLFGKIAKKYGIKNIIAHSHSTQYSNKKASAIRNKLYMPRVKKYATHYFACSEKAFTLFGDKSKLKNTYVMYNAIDYKKYAYCNEYRDEIRSKYKISDDSILIGNVGRLSSEKNQKFLISTFSKIDFSKNDMYLLLVGDGPLFSELEDEIQKHNLSSRVFLAGKTNEIPKYLSAFDVFTLPSLFEGEPLSLIEAQAATLPCLVSDTITKDVDLGLCRFISLNDSESKWIKEMINSKGKDRDITSAVMGTNYDIYNQAKALEKCYCEMVSEEN